MSRLSSALVAWLLVAAGIVTRVSARTVRRWFNADKIKPWRFRSWITPKNLQAFIARAQPILDLYQRVRQLAPDEVIESVDEKTSIQARRRGSMPARKGGAPARIEHTYARAGVVHLFASLNVAAGTVFGWVTKSKTFQDFARFITDLVERRVQQGYRVIHILLDNGSTHRPKYLEKWVQQQEFQAKVVVHWLPVRSSWLNQVEIFFSLLQNFALVPNCLDNDEVLTRLILDFLDLYNLTASPFNWTYTSADLLAKYGLPREPMPDPHPPLESLEKAA